MARVFRQQADQGIVDRAAALFARYGYTQTSVQAVAEAVGLSKAGLLHYFPSKEALRDAARERAQAMEQEVLDEASRLPLGASRDRLALELLIDQALSVPGLVAYSLSAVASQDPAAFGEGQRNSRVLAAFGADADADPERFIRVVGALGALSVLVLLAHRAGKSTAWRSYVLATCFDALGHSSPLTPQTRGRATD